MIIMVYVFMANSQPTPVTILNLIPFVESVPQKVTEVRLRSRTSTTSTAPVPHTWTAARPGGVARYEPCSNPCGTLMGPGDELAEVQKAGPRLDGVVKGSKIMVSQWFLYGFIRFL